MLPASRILTDDEYDLRHTYKIKNQDGSCRQIDLSNFCKHQLCLVFVDGSDKIIIPCAVVAGTYYFTSSSMREQIFSQNLNGLYETANLDQQRKHASILLKPNAHDNDAMNIARFAHSTHAGRCWNFIMNHVRTNKRTGKNGESHCPLAAHIPVEQELVMEVRGQRVKNPSGGTTLVVFEILNENGEYPFDSLEIQRRRHRHQSVTEVKTITQMKAEPDNHFVAGNPSHNYGTINIAKQQTSPNFQHPDIEVTKVLIPPRHEDLLSEEIQFITEGIDEVKLNFQHKMGGNQKTAKGNLYTKKEKSESYEMPLDDFIVMSSNLRNMPGVSNFNISEHLNMPQKFRKSTESLSQRESYDGNWKNKRKYAVVSFSYLGNIVRLVEIDQKGLPNGCSTYILISTGPISNDDIGAVVKGYVKSKPLSEITEEFRKRSMTLKTKNHPISNNNIHTQNWCNLLLEEIPSRIR